MLIQELYQEFGKSTFTHDGELYDLNKLLKLTDGRDVEQVDLEDLRWMVDDESTIDRQRVKDADITKPILVTKWKDKIVTVDGFHRTVNALEAGEETLPAIFVTKKDLSNVKCSHRRSD